MAIYPLSTQPTMTTAMPSPRMLPSISHYLVVLLLLFSFQSNDAFTPSSSSSKRKLSSSPFFQVPTPNSSNCFLTTTSSSSSVLHLFPNPFGTKRKEGVLPYVVERVGNRSPRDKVYEEIADMCINVFFKEQLGANPDDRVVPWKEFQIGYLKTLQAGDLKRRRQRYPRSNEMFLAYEVIPATSKDARTKPLILDREQIQNLPSLDVTSSSKSTGTNRDSRTSPPPLEFVRGRLLGFTEITQRPYGLGGEEDTSTMMRPVLTNLAVSQVARKSGIGSKLVQACEDHVVRDWKMSEIVLEVEDYNGNALDFYSKRGYEVMFSDPASRRFDVGGIFLRKVRCTREIMKKSLVVQAAQQQTNSEQGNQNGITYDFFRKFRETVGVVF